MQDLVTVIIPCYQQGRFLRDAVSSVQAQTHRNWEAIIVNDGSTDETESIARSLCAGDARVRYVSKPNGGLSSARNAGLDLAKGRWVQFLDADDLLLPPKFERHLAVVARSGPDTLTYSGYLRGAHDEPTRRAEANRRGHELCMARPVLDIALRWEGDLSIPIHAALFPASLFHEKRLRFDETLPNHEDWDMWMQALPHVAAVLPLREELAIYRVTPEAMSLDRPRMWQGFAAAIEKQKRLFRHDAEVLRALDYLTVLNDYNHGHGIRGRMHRFVYNGPLGKSPIRRYLWRLTSPPRRPSIESRTG